MSSTEEPAIVIRQPLTTAQNRLIATSYGAVCATLGLSTLAVSPTYILSSQTHPEAASKIEMVLFGTSKYDLSSRLGQKHLHQPD